MSLRLGSERFTDPELFSDFRELVRFLALTGQERPPLPLGKPAPAGF
jgi:hypothetical protein